MPRRNTWLIYLIGSLVGVIGLVVIYIAYMLLSTPQANPTSVALVPDDQNNGITEIDPPQPMPDFTLTDQHNDTIRRSELEGKPALITFGFTHCPDICPLTLGEMRNIHDELGSAGDELHFVFISVDGERDTPSALRDYFQLQEVNTFMVGMTGAPQTVRELSSDYGVDFIYNEADENGNYNVSHTAGMFLLDASGQWVRRYTYGTRRDLLVEDLQALLSAEGNI